MRTRTSMIWALAVAMALVFSTASTAMASTKDAPGYSYWKSLAGVTVAKHWSLTTFSYNGSALLSTPKAVSQTWWTFPPTWCSSRNSKWDWYTVGTNGTGRGNNLVVFTVGVPTPWGPIGSNLADRHLTTVRYNGTYSVSYQ